MIGVKNNGEEKLVARYDGKDFTFEPGRVTALSEDAARHIFCWGLEDKTSALRRFGWLRDSGQYDTAVQRLDCITFLAADVKFADAPEVEKKTSLADPKDSKLTIPEFAKQASK